MRNLQGVFLGASILLALMVCSNVAMAQAPPLVCSGCLEVKAFERSYNQCINLVRESFAKLGTDDFSRCLKYESFMQEIIEIIEHFPIPTPETPGILCHHAGAYHGTVDGIFEIENLLEGVCDVCQHEGELIGRIVADAYCRFSFSLCSLEIPAYLPPISPECRSDFARRQYTECSLDVLDYMPPSIITSCGKIYTEACEAEWDLKAKEYIDPDSGRQCSSVFSLTDSYWNAMKGMCKPPGS